MYTVSKETKEQLIKNQFRLVFDFLSHTETISGTDRYLADMSIGKEIESLFSNLDLPEDKVKIVALRIAKDWFEYKEEKSYQFRPAPIQLSLDMETKNCKSSLEKEINMYLNKEGVYKVVVGVLSPFFPVGIIQRKNYFCEGAWACFADILALDENNEVISFEEVDSQAVV